MQIRSNAMWILDCCRVCSTPRPRVSTRQLGWQCCKETLRSIFWQDDDPYAIHSTVPPIKPGIPIFLMTKQ